MLGLSDGMGSGSAACKESEMVLDLVERFLEAGFFGGDSDPYDELGDGDERGERSVFYR